jgi:hypothetical protein
MHLAREHYQREVALGSAVNFRNLTVIAGVLAVAGCVTGKILSAAGEAPGYYAGLEEDVVDIEISGWRQWVDINRADIMDIQTRTAQIKAGQLKPGCVGLDTHTCVATLAQTLAIADEYLVSHLYGPDKMDVNGKAMFEHTIFVSGFLPGKQAPNNLIRGRLRFILQLGDDRRVNTVRVQLPRDPSFAKTQDEYDATGFYEFIAALGRAECPNLTRNEAARFIENQVKPMSKSWVEKKSCSPSSGCTSENHYQVKDIKFCGQTLKFDSAYGTASDLVTRHNIHGAFGGMSVTVD